MAPMPWAQALCGSHSRRSPSVGLLDLASRRRLLRHSTFQLCGLVAVIHARHADSACLSARWFATRRSKRSSGWLSTRVPKGHWSSPEFPLAVAHLLLGPGLLGCCLSFLRAVASRCPWHRARHRLGPALVAAFEVAPIDRSPGPGGQLFLRKTRR